MPSDKYRVDVVDFDYYRRQISCQAACPVHTDARGYVEAVANGDYAEGYNIARQPNPFVSTCGRVCNAPCEAACRRGEIDAPVNIRTLKRFLTEQHGVDVKRKLPGLRRSFRMPDLTGVAPGNATTAFSMAALDSAIKARAKGSRRTAKVAVIGAGPAGLTAAHDLVHLGYQVTVFDASAIPGGMLFLGVPEYRLPRDLLRFELGEILDAGAELKLNTRLGKDLTLEMLRDMGHEAIFLAIGAHKDRPMDVPGSDMDGVINAVDFLLNYNLGYRMNLGQRVLVIGGGNVAMDVARAATRISHTGVIFEDHELTTTMDVARDALRLGVREVHILYRGRREEMRAALEEINDALHEGIVLHNSRTPTRVLGENDRVAGLETVGLESVYDQQGRRTLVPIPGSEQVHPADSILVAIGQGSDLDFISEKDGIQTTRQGTILVDPETMATTAPGIYAGGDAAFGPRIIIEAVRDGHKAALAMDQYLQGGRVSKVRQARLEPVSPDYLLAEGCLDLPHRRSPVIPLDRRTGVSEVETGFTEEMALEQAKRCLKCHIQTVFSGDKCILCGGCVDICPQNCLKLVNLSDMKGSENLEAAIKARYGVSLEAFQAAGMSVEFWSKGVAMIKDETRCVRCGLCAKRCPTDAITMEAFYFMEELVVEAADKEVVGKA